MPTGHEKLEVWQRSMDLAVEIYRVTETFPKEEVYSLTSQIRRCAVSIPSNVAEGAARNSRKEFARFLYIALGSAAELATQSTLTFQKSRMLQIQGVECEAVVIYREPLTTQIADPAIAGRCSIIGFPER
ncbi:four helix bundle protein [Thermodesulfobacteriota bacterium]